jgi:hypothetical protein
MAESDDDKPSPHQTQKPKAKSESKTFQGAYIRTSQNLGPEIAKRIPAKTEPAKPAKGDPLPDSPPTKPSPSKPEATPDAKSAELSPAETPKLLISEPTTPEFDTILSTYIDTLHTSVHSKHRQTHLNALNSLIPMIVAGPNSPPNAKRRRPTAMTTRFMHFRSPRTPRPFPISGTKLCLSIRMLGSPWICAIVTPALLFAVKKAKNTAEEEKLKPKVKVKKNRTKRLPLQGNDAHCDR